jgi:murein L,D-transpeptidase YcbB/YkuD
MKLFPAAFAAALLLASGAVAAVQPPGPPTVAARTLSAAQIVSLRRALAGAERHGLDPLAFHRRDLDAWLTSSDTSLRLRGEAALMDAVVAYARAVRAGRLDASGFYKDWRLRPPPYDPRPELAQALATDTLEVWLAALPPAYPGYRALVDALSHYRDLAAAGGWPPLEAGPSLKLGDESDRVLLLRERLTLEELPPPPTDNLRLYDAGLEAAIVRYQGLRGLAQDGVTGPATVQSLNVSASDRAALIEANLERWRWLPRQMPDRRIEVNIAAAQLQGFQTGRLAISMRTVVGRPADPTPMFAEEIESVVFNPPWNVPAGIAAREILPRAARDPGYLARNGFVFVGQGSSRRLQQQPGPTSALGLFKFDMPNPYSVYLHDTPNRTVFALDRRTLSHGCVRLETPRDLAIWALGDVEAIDQAVSSGQTSTLRLAAPLPVYLLYWTAFVSEDRTLNFRDDVYGWDRRLLAAWR